MLEYLGEIVRWLDNAQPLARIFVLSILLVPQKSHDGAGVRLGSRPLDFEQGQNKNFLLLL